MKLYDSPALRVANELAARGIGDGALDANVVHEFNSAPPAFDVARFSAGEASCLRA